MMLALPSQVLHFAATRIQKIFRGSLQRKSYERMVIDKLMEVTNALGAELRILIA